MTSYKTVEFYDENAESFVTGTWWKILYRYDGRTYRPSNKRNKEFEYRGPVDYHRCEDRKRG